jgi:hypothetical protein
MLTWMMMENSVTSFHDMNVSVMSLHADSSELSPTAA